MALIPKPLSQWPDGRVPFEIRVEDFEPDEIELIIQAVDQWNEKTILRFHQKTDENGGFVRFISGSGCGSGVGYPGINGIRTIRCPVGDLVAAGFARAIPHEFGHAIGFRHEHQRPDQAQFITVLYDNIKDGDEDQYEPFSPFTHVPLTAYDYDSIMHYGPTVSLEDDLPEGSVTFNTLQDDAAPGTTDQLSKDDVLGVCRIYAAPHFSSLWVNETHDGQRRILFWTGFAHWGKRCGDAVIVDPEVADNDNPVEQGLADLGLDAEENSVIVWEEHRNGDLLGRIRVAIINPIGKLILAPFTVSSDDDSENSGPAIAVAGGGFFTVAWRESISAAARKIVIRGLREDGSEFYPRTVVAESGGGEIPQEVRIARIPGGTFVLVWSVRLENGLFSLKAKSFNAIGAPMSEVIEVVDGVDIGRLAFQVTIGGEGEGDGPYFIVWEENRNTIRLAGFEFSGASRFETLTVNSRERGERRYPDVSVSRYQRIVVVWSEDAESNSLGQIRARQFDLSGQPLMNEFTANQRGGGDQTQPRVAHHANGHFQIVWKDDEDLNGDYQIKHAVFDLDNELVVNQATVNPSTAGKQDSPVTSGYPN